MKLDSSDSADMKRRWKIVRLDSHTDVPGEIVSADDDTGECTVTTMVPKADHSGMEPQTKTLSFGAAGIKIVGRNR